MTAATALTLATTAAERHAAGCTVCTMPGVDRSNAGCATGRQVALAWAAAWRRHVDALSGRVR